jgi:hypothetical protein
MHAVVLYESLFGNTSRIAEAVAAEVRTQHPEALVDCVGVDTAGYQLPATDLVIVGAPTHFWGMTSRISRIMEHEYELRVMRARTGPRPIRRAAVTNGVRSWLATIPPGRGTAAAVFDTRMDRVLTGGAAPAIARRLRRRGYRLVSAPQAFLVQGITGPLRPDQLDQARQWAQQVARSVCPSGSADGRPDSASSLERNMIHPTQQKQETTFQAPPGLATVDITRLLTTAELVAGAVLIARILARRPSGPKAQVTMGPGGWVSMKGGSLAIRPARRPWGRPRPIAHLETPPRAPVWARVLSAVPLQALTNRESRP